MLSLEFSLDKLIIMIGFFIKKAFFDGWDNLIGLVLQNLIYIVLFGCFLATTYLIDVSLGLFYALIILIAFIVCIFVGGTSSVVYGYSNYEKETWEPFGRGIRRNIRHSLLFFFIVLVLFFIATFVIPFYISMQNTVGLILAVVLLWVFIALSMALVYYFPLMNLLPGDRPLKTLKKCFIILGDNIGFSVFFLIYNVIVVALSIGTMGLIPGVGGYMLASQDAMKLLMLKYDYLEEHPDANRRKLPWYDLLFDERDKVGPRSFKSMIFPWKY